MDVIDRAYAKKLLNGLSSGYVSNTVTDNADGSKTLTINFVNGDKAQITFSPVKGDKGDTGTSVADLKITTTSGVRHLTAVFDDGTEKDCGVLPNEQYDDTQVKSDISDLQTGKVDKVTGKSLVDDTEIARLAKVDNYDDTTIKTTIQTVANGLMASAGYSADYKTVEIVTVGGTKKNIPVAPIINNASITELKDVDVTDQADGKTLIYNSATGKHEYKTVEGTDEKVKMTSAGDSKYMEDLIDKDTIVNESGTLKAKTLDGLEASIAELNFIKGLQMPVQDLVNAFANGGLKTIDTPFATYADLQSYDVSTLLDDIRYLVRVLADETHNNKITAYLIKKDQTNPTFYGFLSDSRDFTTNPIDLVTEITGKLKAKNIDSDDLFALLTLSDVYKTATTKDEFFGTNGAKAMYDELNTAIGKKANNTDLTTHTGDTDIHITSAERTKWNKVDNKVNKTDIVDNLTSTDTDKPLSANQGKILKGEVDLKANKTEVVKKTDITTTIDSTSTDTKVPGALTVYNAIYNLVGLDKDTNILTIKRPSAEIEGGEIHLETPTTGCTLTSDIVIDTYGNYIRFFEGGGTHRGCRINLSNMKSNVLSSVCTTSVADVPWTQLTLGSGMSGSMCYRIKNGICYVNVNALTSSTMSTKNQTMVIGLPVPETTNVWYTLISNNPSQGGLLVSIDSTGRMTNYVGLNNTTYYGSFSYPVKES